MKMDCPTSEDLAGGPENRIAPLNGEYGLRGAILRALAILRAALRGYCMGQPINEARPRKGCC